MNEIFAQAKSILVVGVDDVDPENLLPFREIIQTKAQQAHITFENVQMLFESRRATSSFDIILFDLISKTDEPTSIDLLNEFFRLLHPNGYLITHIEHIKQTQAIDHFKMCGFSSYNPLDSNSSFLIENKNDDVKRRGSLWLCQKPSFDVGYSVPLRRAGVKLIKQISTTGGGKKTWTVEDDRDDLIHDNNQKKSEVKNCDTTSSGDQKACKTCTFGLAQVFEQEKHIKAQENYSLSDTSRYAGCLAHGLPSSKPGERVNFPTVSDV
ncbi:unnamed protein product [Rotaria sordida]|uniref:Anamorsin N-terminal domain-containing protein n=1 Tax=Rotaria sordida TaxID=392033 RepID=A0A813UW61_9BILA|nr:unnamed protein product [Rotaria sordida]CAF0982938.1 unnamed protein product [Rotaria sordida]